jgi:2-oxoglutarate dehydrogenase E1 component
MIDDGEGIDWSTAEALAYGTLLVEGYRVRLSGQDSERGTFSQRHAVLHDSKTGDQHMPLRELRDAKAPFEIYNSALSELAVLGFEYGYSVVAPDALVLWEAQFGDFVNGAQVIIDQFISAGRAKWGQTSRLVLLLPHGYEGQGPEHSSGRVERFLQQAAEDNMRVANCTTPAQYFHLLRRQALLEARRPLIVMTPKSLLRHPKATSRLGELANGSFQPVIVDAKKDADVRRVVLCTGKVYYDLLAKLDQDGSEKIAVVRVEELYPFPEERLRAVVDRFDSADEFIWVQEEPQNMGAWTYMEPRLRALLDGPAMLGYVGRPERASPAEGYASDHETEQARIVSEAIALGASRKSRSAEKRR